MLNLWLGNDIMLVKTLVCNIDFYVIYIIIVSCLKVTNITNSEFAFTYVRLHLTNSTDSAW